MHAKTPASEHTLTEPALGTPHREAGTPPDVARQASTSPRIAPNCTARRGKEGQPREGRPKVAASRLTLVARGLERSTGGLFHHTDLGGCEQGPPPIDG